MLKILIAGAVAAGSVVTLGVSAQAAPPGDGCPGGRSGFVLWDVTTEPYAADNAVDEKGNDDGWVCAKPISIVLDENGEPFQLYNFLDNQFQPG